jgi:hypothetical protein
VTNPLPKITSLSPTSVLVGSGGFTLTINGSGFNSSTTVHFGADTSLIPTVVSASQMTIDVPAGDLLTARSLVVTVTNPLPVGGSATATFTVANPQPSVANLSPVSVMAGSGAFTLTINGSGFLTSTTVHFGADIALKPTFVNSGQLTLNVPAADVLNAANLTVTLTNPVPGGGSTTASFPVTNPAPSIASVSPTSVLAGSVAFVMTINGTGFNSQSRVTLANSASLVPTAVTPTKITVTIPATAVALAQTTNVTVTNPAPGGGSDSTPFTINNPSPTITSLTPATALAGGPAFTLVILGTGFNSSTTVSFGADASLKATLVSAAELTLAVPAIDIATAGSPNVTVTNPAPGGGTVSKTFSVNNPHPSITSLSPASVLVSSGAFTLTINGSGFNSATTLQVGADASLTPTLVSSTKLTVTVPAADIVNAQSLTITVTNPAPGGASSSATLSVTNPAPTVISLSPSSAVAGTYTVALTINGSGFNSSTTVHFGTDTSLVPTVLSSSQITLTVPAADLITVGSDTVTVTNPAPGGGTGTATFSVTKPSSTGPPPPPPLARPAG